MTTPDTAIRAAYITAFTAAGITVPIFDMEVPKSAVPIPATRILLTTQTKSQYATNKCGHIWKATILVDIVSEQAQGYIDRSVVEGIETLVNNAIDLPEGDIDVTGFTVYNTQVQDTHDMSMNTQTVTYSRKLLRFQHLIGWNG